MKCGACGKPVESAWYARGLLCECCSKKVDAYIESLKPNGGVLYYDSPTFEKVYEVWVSGRKFVPEKRDEWHVEREANGGYRGDRDHDGFCGEHFFLEDDAADALYEYMRREREG